MAMATSGEAVVAAVEALPLRFFGDQVLLWLAVAGVAALLKAYPAAFHVVQWLGAAYLVYLGLRMILAKPGAAPTLDIKPRQYLWQTLVITVFNPKAIILYMAFFPLFIDPQRHQGLIECESQPGRTDFRILIPLP